MKIELPRNTPVDLSGGQIDPVWLERFDAMAKFVNLFSEVNFATMTTGQVLIWNATTKKFGAGAN